MRDRAYRRYVEEIVVKKRLRSVIHTYWFHFVDANKIKIRNPMLKDFIGTESNFRFKTHVTTKGDTDHKVKYSPNKSKPHWRDSAKRGTREKEKRKFINILQYYGLK